MSSKLPVVSGQRCARAFEQLGFVYVSRRSSHMKYRRESITIIIPDHNELDRGTLAGLIRQSQVEHEAFMKVLNKV